MNPLLAQFIAESRDQLEVTGTGLLAIESNPHDLDRLNTVFRAAHTIKGSSGLFEIRPVTLLVHAAEDLLDALRSQAVPFERGMIDVLLDAFDQVSRWIDELEHTESLPAALEADARTLSGTLRAFLKDRTPESATTDGPFTPTFDDLHWIGRFPEEERTTLYRWLTESGEPLVAFRYVPDANCFFNGEDPFYQIRQIPRLAPLDLAPIEPWPPLAELDAYRCVLRFEGIACAPPAEVAKLFRYVPDQVCLLETSPHVLAVPTGRRDEDDRCDGFVAEALEMAEQEDWAGLRSTAAALLESADPGDWIASALRWLARLLESATPEPTVVRLLLEAIRTQQGPDWLNAPLATAAAPTSAAAPAPCPLSDAEQAALQHIATEQLRILELPVEPEA